MHAQTVKVRRKCRFLISRIMKLKPRLVRSPIPQRAVLADDRSFTNAEVSR